MAAFLGFLCSLLIAAMVVSFIKPRFVAPWMKAPTRLKAFALYAVLFFVVVAVGVRLDPDRKADTASPSAVTAETGAGATASAQPQTSNTQAGEEKQTAAASSAPAPASAAPVEQKASTTPAPQDPSLVVYEPGDHIVLTHNYVVCADADSLGHLIDLAKEGDNLATGLYMHKHGCRMVSAGDAAIVEDESIWHGKICIRFPGHPDCDWTLIRVVGKAGVQ